MLAVAYGLVAYYCYKLLQIIILQSGSTCRWTLLEDRWSNNKNILTRRGLGFGLGGQEGGGGTKIKGTLNVKLLVWGDDIMHMPFVVNCMFDVHIHMYVFMKYVISYI